MIIHNCEQRSGIWHNLRLGKVTASNAHRLLTKAKFETYFVELLAETVTRHLTEHFVSESMQWGIDHEEEAAEWYIDKTGLDARLCGFIEVEGLIAGCSPDLVIGDKGMAQIKCPTPKTHIGYIMSGPSSEIMAQMQFEMFCYQAEWNDFVSYDPRWPEHYKGYIQRLERNDAEIKVLEFKTREMQTLINEYLFDNSLEPRKVIADIEVPEAIRNKAGYFEGVKVSDLQPGSEMYLNV